MNIWLRQIVVKALWHTTTYSYQKQKRSLPLRKFAIAFLSN
ncbi:hypothetical protein [Nodularia sp. LEGE 04288]|nr:hypothetical protein [Nodularia sp. LEGE 04288]